MLISGLLFLFAVVSGTTLNVDERIDRNYRKQLDSDLNAISYRDIVLTNTTLQFGKIVGKLDQSDYDRDTDFSNLHTHINSVYSYVSNRSDATDATLSSLKSELAYRFTNVDHNVSVLEVKLTDELSLNMGNLTLQIGDAKQALIGGINTVVSYISSETDSVQNRLYLNMGNLTHQIGDVKLTLLGSASALTTLVTDKTSDVRDDISSFRTHSDTSVSTLSSDISDQFDIAVDDIKDQAYSFRWSLHDEFVYTQNHMLHYHNDETEVLLDIIEHVKSYNEDRAGQILHYHSDETIQMQGISDKVSANNAMLTQIIGQLVHDNQVIMRRLDYMTQFLEGVNVTAFVTDAPTIAPTAAPTVTGTQVPTVSPTFAPTLRTTEDPDSIVTYKPSASPTTTVSPTAPV